MTGIARRLVGITRTAACVALVGLVRLRGVACPRRD